MAADCQDAQHDVARNTVWRNRITMWGVANSYGHAPLRLTVATQVIRILCVLHVSVVTKGATRVIHQDVILPTGNPPLLDIPRERCRWIEPPAAQTRTGN